MFKFIRSEHLDGFLSGKIRIATPEDFRIADGKAGGRNDTDECAIRWNPKPGTYRDAQATELLAHIVGLDAPTNVELVIPPGTGFIHAPPCYLFSYSTKISKLLVKRMREEFGCDACVAISDDEKFPLALTASDARLQRTVYTPDGWDWVSGSVKYRTYSTDAQGPQGDVFTKRPEYRWQQEGRIIWQGREPHEPFIIDAPQAAEFLRAVNLDGHR